MPLSVARSPSGASSAAVVPVMRTATGAGICRKACTLALTLTPSHTDHVTLRTSVHCRSAPTATSATHASSAAAALRETSRLLVSGATSNSEAGSTHGAPDAAVATANTRPVSPSESSCCASVYVLLTLKASASSGESARASSDVTRCAARPCTAIFTSARTLRWVRTPLGCARTSCAV